MSDHWSIATGDGPIVATAVHAGHEVRPEVAALMELEEAVRFREEDPFTDAWVRMGDSQIVAHHSRFEYDLNRPRDSAVYLTPDDAWGLDVWREPPPAPVVEGSLRYWDEYYQAMAELCDATAAAYGPFIIIDLHSYNHRRGGPEAPVDDPQANPEINVGTESVTDPRWRPLVERFMRDLSAAPFDGGHLDVRENVRFKGGHFPRWVNGRWGAQGCALAIEVKKFYMDEWSGEPDETVIGAIGEALETTIEGIREELARL